MTRIEMIIVVVIMLINVYLTPYCIKKSLLEIKEARKIIKDTNEKYN
ncbi:hypothetical protein [Ligilactobacillus agilis]|nr:hypothetical protein [Ligilactobacillus agilis]